MSNAFKSYFTLAGPRIFPVQNSCSKFKTAWCFEIDLKTFQSVEEWCKCANALILQ